LTALVLDRLGATGREVPMSGVRVLGVVLVLIGVALIVGFESKSGSLPR
jgi:uncharacterized membrane protein YdcZ (DUF606 family)